MIVFVADNTKSLEVKALYEKLGISKPKLALRLGAKPSDVNNWVAGTSNKVPDEVLSKVRRIMASVKGNAHQVSVTYGVLEPIEIIGKASAGFGHSNVDVDQGIAYVPANLAQESNRGFIIDGDSMEPAIEHGDTCIFRSEPRVTAGLVYLFKNRDEDYFCKFIAHKNDRYVGVSFNDDYGDMDLNDCTILGYLIGIYRAIGGYEYLVANFQGLRRKNNSNIF